MVIWDSIFLSRRKVLDAMQCTANASHEKAEKHNNWFCGALFARIVQPEVIGKILIHDPRDVPGDSSPSNVHWIETHVSGVAPRYLGALSRGRLSKTSLATGSAEEALGQPT